MVSDWLRIKITSSPGDSFLDRMIALVEGASRKKTPNEIALNTLLVSLTHYLYDCNYHFIPYWYL